MRLAVILVLLSGSAIGADLSAGWTHSAFVVDGVVWTCGDNVYGQLGQPDVGRSLKPLPVSGLKDVVAVSASWHTLAVTTAGDVYAWGRNTYGQLGNGTFGIDAIEERPIRVANLAEVVAVAAGWDHSLALTRDGSVYAWGSRSHGQVGDGVRKTGSPLASPVKISGLPKILAIAAGGHHSLALSEDGTVYAWGSNWNGQLGNGKIGKETHSAVPRPVISPGGDGVLKGARGIAAGGHHSVAVTTDGQVLAWGYNGTGQIPASSRGGFWDHRGDRNIPTPTLAKTGKKGDTLEDAAGVAAGYESTYAVTEGGNILSAGWGMYGELGTGAYGSGNRDTMVPAAAGRVVAWKNPPAGQWRPQLVYRYTDRGHLKDGIDDLEVIDDFSGPVMVVGPGTDTGTTTGKIRRSANYVEATAALTYPVRTEVGQPVTGLLTLLSFGSHPGDDDYVTDVRLRWTETKTGQSIDIPLASGKHPAGALLPPLDGFVSIASGMHHALARDREGEIWVWGHNGFGQLGIGNASDQPVARELTSPSPREGRRRGTSLRGGAARQSTSPPRTGTANFKPCSQSDAVAAEPPEQGAINVRENGAVGNGITLDQIALQKAIDSCSEAGGGTVWFPPGTYRTGTLELRSGVRIHLSQGAVILASGNREHFPQSALVRAADVENISITGRGTIDGRGHFVGARDWRHNCIYMDNCRNVRVEGISTINAGAWTQHYIRCIGLTIRNATIRSVRPGRNNDGLDLSGCEDVTITGCTVISDDDAIVIKSQKGERENRNIRVVDNTCHTYRGAFKLGTETRGVYENLLCKDLVCYGSKVLELYSVDGSVTSGITVENVRGHDALVALNVRLGARLRPHYWAKGLEPKVGTLRDIHIRNLEVDVRSRAWRDILLEHRIPGAEWATGRPESTYDSCISGLPGHLVENVTVQKATIRVPGGEKTVPDAATLPERPEVYPHGGNFGLLPAYGLFVRHAKNVTLDDVIFEPREPDARPPIAEFDVQGLTTGKD